MTKTNTKEQQAQEYAEKKNDERLSTFPEAIRPALQPEYDTDDIAQAYSDGYTACEQSQWRSVEEELPEDDKLVLAHFSDIDPELCYATAYYRDGKWHTPDDWYYNCKIDFWMPIKYYNELNGGHNHVKLD